MLAEQLKKVAKASANIADVIDRGARPPPKDVKKRIKQSKAAKAIVIAGMLQFCGGLKAASYLRTSGPVPVRFSMPAPAFFQLMAELPPLLMNDKELMKPKEPELPEPPPPAEPILPEMGMLEVEILPPEPEPKPPEAPAEDENITRVSSVIREEPPIDLTPKPREQDPIKRTGRSLLTPQMLIQFFETTTSTNTTGGAKSRSIGLPMFLPPLGRP